jgi:hypothetical protein
MIKQTWNGPHTVINNRVITPGAEIEVDQNDNQTKAYQALGYLKPGPEKPTPPASAPETSEAPKAAPKQKEPKNG